MDSMNPEDIDALFFDFDGVLADSVNVKTEAFAALFAHHGSDVEQKVVKHHLANGGMTRRDKFKVYYQEFLKEPLSAEKMEELCEGFAQLVVEKVIAADEIPGAENFLKEYTQKASVPAFVISATPQEEIELIVARRGWSKYFKEVLGAPTSKGEHVARLVDDYGYNTTKCFFFGDALSDYNAAAEHQVPFVALAEDEASILVKTYPEMTWYTNFEEIRKSYGIS
ncbi:MAG: haloacid dehalogenase/epoxide hydrolase [Myxococcales bacterium]|nr:haloacid dehalogenase/epoxide hydrolase [Myxococcales bacterium]